MAPGDDAAIEFMSRVVPWPEQDGPGFINLHWLRPSLRAPGKIVWSGKVCRGPKELIEASRWALTKATIRDQYFCLSLQSMAKVRSGRATPERSQHNAAALRSLWIDLDVTGSNKAGKGYATTAEALDALSAFLQAKNLPPPSALVASGSGGVHVYWIGTKNLPPSAWQPLAEGLKQAILDFGLKADAGCTIDCARVLRVPGTRNYKGTPPTETKLLRLAPAEKDYDLQAAFAHIAAAAPAATKSITSTISPNTYFDPAVFPKRAPVTETLSEGIERFERDRPLQARPLFKECGFLREALRTGGKDYGQPLWNLTTLCATFIEEGQKLAHAMGDKHPGYTRESTDELWERKLRERKEKGLGWPSCRTIRDNGCTSCATCPHFTQGKTPLHLSSPRPEPGELALVTAAVTPAVEQQNLHLPKGYVLYEGVVTKMVPVEQASGPPVPQPAKLLCSRVYRPFLQHEPVYSLCFTATTDLGRTADVQLPTTSFAENPAKALAGFGVMYYSENKKYLEGFLTSWVAQLQAEQRAVEQQPMGWYEDDHGKKMGFIYGGTVFMKGGHERPAGIKDATVKKVWCPKGDPDVWWRAYHMVKQEGRPELEVLMATGFAGPLMRSLGTETAAISAFGETGARKSTAARVGQAVWANHKQARESAMTTPKSAVEKLGYLRNITLFWDEVKGESEQKAAYEVCFGQDGIAGGKLNRDSSQRGKAEWQTLMVICANISFSEYVVKQSGGMHAGGLVRCLEFRVNKPLDGGPGQIDTRTADRLMLELESNFGHMGIKYAQLLASDPDAVDKLTGEVFDNFAARVNQKIDERRWIGACVAIISGAILANQLGTNFDVEAIRDYLVGVYNDNRTKRQEANLDEHGLQWKAQDLLGQFLRDYHGNTVWTDVATRPGKPRPTNILHTPNPMNPRPIYVHFATEDRLCRIDRRRWEEFLALTKTQARGMDEMLASQLGMKKGRFQLASQTTWNTGIIPAMSFPVPPGSFLEEIMLAWRAAPTAPTFQPSPAAPANPAPANPAPQAFVQQVATPGAALETGLASAMSAVNKDQETLRRVLK